MARIGITGNPGVGKHTVTNLLSKKIKNSKIIDINKLINDDNVIIVGHLLPYVVKRNELDFIAILRRSPYSLIETYNKRQYSNKKIHENLLSEILGICFYDSLKVFGKKKISEIDTTYDDPEESVKKIIHHYDYKLKRQIGLVDWLDLIYRTGDAKKFLD